VKTNAIYITDSEWFENSSLKNPICPLDHNLEQRYPTFYNANYGLKILATKAPTEEEKNSPIYNDYRERYGASDIAVMDSAVASCSAKNIFLNGFEQEQFDYISPLIKETAEILYLFKCTGISNLGALSEFKKLKGVFIFANHGLKSLWDMRSNRDLQVISFTHITKLQNIEALTESCVEYVSFDSSDHYGNKKEMLFDQAIFQKMPKLKHLFLTYQNIL